MRPLGDNQRGVLRSMINYGRNGEWHASCGWYWGTHSGTQRILESLVKRGLVERFGDRHYGYNRYVITPAGREAAK